MAKQHVPQLGDRYRVIDISDTHHNKIGTVIMMEEWYYYPIHMEFDDGRKMAYRIEELQLVESATAER